MVDSTEREGGGGGTAEEVAESEGVDCDSGVVIVVVVVVGLLSPVEVMVAGGLTPSLPTAAPSAIRNI